MGYVWLIYEGEEGMDGNPGKTTLDTVIAVKTTDGKAFEPGHKIQVRKGSIFLCEEKDVKKYTYEDEYSLKGDEENWFYAFGGSRKTKPTKQQKKDYYEKWKKYEIDKDEKKKDFEKRKKALFHYICEKEAPWWWGGINKEKKKKDTISFRRIFDWILGHHHEYLPKTKVLQLDFTDVLESLEKEKCLLCYKITYKDSSTIDWEIVFLDDFFNLPEVKKAKKIFEIEQKKTAEESEKKYSWMNKKSEGFAPFPSQENPQIELRGSSIILGKKTIDLDDRENLDKHKKSYENFENEKESEKKGYKSPNETLKGNFFMALRVILSALDKSIGIYDKEGECKFKLIDIKKPYENYRELFNKYVVRHNYNHSKIQKMKGWVNALLRRAKVGEKEDTCIQIESLQKKESPNKENGWYIIKEMKKFSRDGKKTNSDGKKTRRYGKKK